MKNFFKKWFLLFLLLVIGFSFFYFHLPTYLTFKTLKNYQAIVQVWTQENLFYSVAIYLLGFIILIACGIPCATFLSICGGFIFGMIGLFYALFATTLGGTVLFLAVRSALGHVIAKKTTGWMKKMEKGFKENAFTYLLMLRLVPVFPCWISNISAGLLNIPIKTFIAATVLGIFPSTFVCVLLGCGLDKIFLTEEAPSLKMLLTPSLFIPLLCLALIGLIPIFYKRFTK